MQHSGLMEEYDLGKTAILGRLQEKIGLTLEEAQGYMKRYGKQ